MTKRGPEHPNWKGGRYIDSRGYVQVQTAPNTYQREHRLVMEQMLGRPLEDGETVHHKNGDKTDNRPDNLELTTTAAHTKHHWDTGDLAEHHIRRPQAKCHPDRPHHAKGLCYRCYMTEAQRRYTARHPERVQARDRRYKKANRDKINARRRARRRELREQGLSAEEVNRRV